MRHLSGKSKSDGVCTDLATQGVCVKWHEMDPENASAQLSWMASSAFRDDSSTRFRLQCVGWKNTQPSAIHSAQ